MATLGWIVAIAWVSLVFVGVIYAWWHRYATGEKLWADPDIAFDEAVERAKNENLGEALEALEQYANTKEPFDWVTAAVAMRAAAFAIEYDLEVSSHGDQQ